MSELNDSRRTGNSPRDTASCQGVSRRTSERVKITANAIYYLQHDLDVIRAAFALLVALVPRAAVQRRRGHSGLPCVDRGRRNEASRGLAGRAGGAASSATAAAALCSDGHDAERCCSGRVGCGRESYELSAKAAEANRVSAQLRRRLTEPQQRVASGQLPNFTFSLSRAVSRTFSREVA